MQKNELNTLLELKENPSLTQRSLSHRLNISLGLTNAILQNLIHRGWVKAKKLTGRKILYLITPQGMARATSNIASSTTTSSTPKPTTEDNQKIFDQNQIKNIFAKEKNILLVYLFGSQATQVAQKAQKTAKTSPLSDYDFAVLLSHKPPFPFKYELKNKLVNTLNTKNTKQVDLIILNDVPLELKYKVIATGKIIYHKNPTTKIEFEADTLSRYFDYLPVLRTQKEDILKSKGEKDGDRIQRYRTALGKTEKMLAQIRAS